MAVIRCWAAYKWQKNHMHPRSRTTPTMDVERARITRNTYYIYLSVAAYGQTVSASQPPCQPLSPPPRGRGGNAPQWTPCELSSAPPHQQSRNSHSTFQVLLIDDEKAERSTSSVSRKHFPCQPWMAYLSTIIWLEVCGWERCGGRRGRQINYKLIIVKFYLS